MAKVVLIGLDQAAAGQIRQALAVNGHQIIQYHQQDVATGNVLDADIAFAGGEPAYYMPLLARVRKTRPTMPFIVVARIPNTREWLDALEAGATDYCSTPIDTRQLHWMMKYTLPRPPFIGA